MAKSTQFYCLYITVAEQPSRYTAQTYLKQSASIEMSEVVNCWDIIIDP